MNNITMSLAKMLNKTAIIHKRPHFTLRDNAVYFLNSKRPMYQPTGPECAVIEQLNEPRTVQVLSEQIGDTAEEAISQLSAKGICDIIEPIKANRRKALVIEPHSDDAALSIGGIMWQQRQEVEFKLVTLASRTNYTSSFHTGRPYFERDVVSDLRAEEGLIFMQHFGGHYDVLGLCEATMRYHDADWSVEFFKDHRSSVSASNNRRASAETLAIWVREIADLLAADDAQELWIPLGAGTHSDHDLTRNALLTVLMQDPALFGKYKIFLYLDVPYGRDFSEHTQRILQELQAAGAQLSDQKADVSGVFDVKMNLLSIFASQFKIKSMQKAVEHSAAAPGGGSAKFEHIWQMERLPETLDFWKLYIDQPTIDAGRDDVHGWLKGAAGVKRLRVLALMASGRWGKDIKLLTEAFPSAQIEVYAGAGAVAEINAHSADNVRVFPVGSGSKQWGLLAARLAVAPPAHALFVAGDKAKTARDLSRLWPLGKTLVVPSMNHFALAVQT